MLHRRRQFRVFAIPLYKSRDALWIYFWLGRIAASDWRVIAAPLCFPPTVLYSILCCVWELLGSLIPTGEGEDAVKRTSSHRLCTVHPADLIPPLLLGRYQRTPKCEWRAQKRQETATAGRGVWSFMLQLPNYCSLCHVCTDVRDQNFRRACGTSVGNGRFVHCCDCLP